MDGQKRWSKRKDRAPHSEKTFGYHAYKMGKDLSVIQKLLNHSALSVTLSYIGIIHQEDLDNVIYITCLKRDRTWMG